MLLPVKGYENYLINDSGTIFSRDTGNEKKSRIKDKNYLITNLYVNGKPKTLYVHRLVAQTFLGDCPTGLVVHHIDGNKLNNNVNNLQYVTPQENTRLRKQYTRTKLTDIYPFTLIKEEGFVIEQASDYLKLGLDSKRVQELRNKNIKSYHGFKIKE